MSIAYQTQTVFRTAGADLTDYEGSFVTVDATTGTTVSLATASTTAAQVFGLLHSTAPQGDSVTVILPGFAGIPLVKLHSSATAVKPGDTLALAANGQVKAATTGTIVAVALEGGSGGDLIAARLIEPKAVAAGS